MAVKMDAPILKDAHARIAQLQIGAALAKQVDDRATNVGFSTLISGGFTLNVINSIFVDPHLNDRNSFDWLTCILAHEYCHVQQGFWVDSIEQELIAYQMQLHVANEIGLAVGDDFKRFATLDPKNKSDLEQARVFILDLAKFSAPTQTIYASLPLFQPTGAADNFGAAIKQLSAAGLAGIQAWQLGRGK